MTLSAAIKILIQTAEAYANGCDLERLKKIKRAIARLKH